MAAWSVHIESRMPKGTLDTEDPRIDALVDALRRYGAAVAGGNDGVDVTMTAKGAEAPAAVRRAVKAFCRALDDCGLPRRKITRIEALTHKALARELGQ